MPPEYAMEGLFSEKSDVYSFGVLLLEIVSGRRNSSFNHNECSLSLVGFVSLHGSYIFKTSLSSKLCVNFTNLRESHFQYVGAHFPDRNICVNFN
jgi:hypothetical protein